MCVCVYTHTHIHTLLRRSRNHPSPLDCCALGEQRACCRPESKRASEQESNLTHTRQGNSTPSLAIGNVGFQSAKELTSLTKHAEEERSRKGEDTCVRSMMLVGKGGWGEEGERALLGPL